MRSATTQCRVTGAVAGRLRCFRPPGGLHCCACSRRSTSAPARLSLIETLRNAVGRTHTALVAAGIITRAVSLKNIGSGWILVQTVWLTAITTVTARMRDKWPTENTLALLGPALDGSERRLSSSDWFWMSLAVVAALAGQYFVWFHA